MMNVIKSFRLSCLGSARNDRKLKIGYFHILRNLRRARERIYGKAEDAKYEEFMKKLFPSQLNEEVSAESTSLNATSSNHQTELNAMKEAVPIVEESSDIVTEENQFQLLADRVTPLHNLSYDAQLLKKKYACQDAMREFGRSYVSIGGVLPEQSFNLPCAVDPIIPSPITESYRNKDEFSIQHGVDGNPKTVGFFLSSLSDSSPIVCVGPERLAIVRENHKRLAQLFQDYIRQSSLAACLNFNEGGHWRNLVVRSNKQGDVMAVAILHPQQLTTEQLCEEMEKFKEYVLQHKGDTNLKSLYYQACNRTKCTHKESPFQLLYGERFIFEEMNGVKYRISPESFFQTNTWAAELLYKVIYNACRPSESATILDICCGVGPVSFTFAPHVKQCIGVDASSAAIHDARFNAKLNGFKNVQFYTGKFEYVLPDILNEIYSNELIAVVNPGRAALGSDAIRVLRELKYLKKIVYVTCKPSAALPNFLNLCQSSHKKKNLGVAFHPMRAVPLDMFPQTNHCELVVLFKRL